FSCKATVIIQRVYECNAVLMFTGAEQFSRYSGYSDSFRWEGDHDDQTPRDEWQRRCTEIVAIDALHYSQFLEQFRPENMSRELNKVTIKLCTSSEQSEMKPLSRPEQTSFNPVTRVSSW
ncbi:hypothetical protein cypCar_00025262, partial [Cyprinus carpio]